MNGSIDSTLTTLSDIAGMTHAGLPAPTPRMPVIFVGHGSPMNAIQDNAYTRHLAAWGRALPRPAAILAISAHWLTPGLTAVDVQDMPRTIHDFGGFPPPLFAMQYPAFGAPDVARELVELVKERQIVQASDWGIDHGTWSVLHHMYPEADIPVCQLSIDFARDSNFHYTLGRELNALRDKGVLIMGSGNITHDLRDLDWHAANGPIASRSWAQSFDDSIKRALENRDDLHLIEAIDSRAGRAAHPSPDHYLPLLYALGAADPSETGTTVFHEFQVGTISMRCVQFGGELIG